jgi:hypothetical protein
VAAGSAPRPAPRDRTEADAYDVEIDGGKEDWKSSLAVEDEQLVAWEGSEETVTSSEEYRKR